MSTTMIFSRTTGRGVAAAVLFAASSFLTMVGCDKSATAPEVESAPEIHQLSLSARHLDLGVGDTYRVQASLVADEGASGSIAWHTSSTTIVTVADGFLTARSAGAATVSAWSVADPTVMSRIDITVSDAPIVAIESVALDRVTAELREGDDLRLAVTVHATGDIDRSVRFTSSDDAVATVSRAGVVTAITAGSARILAVSLADPTKSAGMDLTVTPLVTPMDGHPVSGWDATLVEYSSADRRVVGTFTQVYGLDWVEANNQGTFRFVETGRDEWSVYLEDTDRGVQVQLDLWVKTVKIGSYAAYIVTGADSLPVAPMEGNPVSGWDASFVQYSSADRQVFGTFTQVAGSTWREANNQGTFTFVETGRDEWSVYLEDTDRGVQVQLDLWVKTVKIGSDPAYIVTAAR